MDWECRYIWKVIRLTWAWISPSDVTDRTRSPEDHTACKKTDLLFLIITCHLKRFRPRYVLSTACTGAGTAAYCMSAAQVWGGSSKSKALWQRCGSAYWLCRLQTFHGNQIIGCFWHWSWNTIIEVCKYVSSMTRLKPESRHSHNSMSQVFYL
jgi:hypothetical protein